MSHATGHRAAGAGEPVRFPSPFDETGPHPLARAAVDALQSELGAGLLAHLHDFELPGNGKMFGVLVVRDARGATSVFRAISGTIAGSFDVPGFVPPMFDRDARAAFEPAGDAVVKRLGARAAAYASSSEVERVCANAVEVAERHQRELAELRGAHIGRRQRRHERRRENVSDPAALEEESRRDKRERKAMIAAHQDEVRGVNAALRYVERRLMAHARLGAMVSRSLMRRIHDTYRVTNARGEQRSLRSLFAPAEPPSGAGDCAAPKLLAHAYAEGLTPIALAEFWWGAPPAAGGRVSGNHYPACRDKCGPILAFMLEGLDVDEPQRFVPPDATALALDVLYEDEWIVVVDKPCGLLSVPGRGEPATRDSVLRRLRAKDPALMVAHRLDLDTSGVLVAARDMATYKALQKQFARRTVMKRYVAIVDGVPEGDAGTIELAIRTDLSDRPRQIHDPVHGRRATTAWKVVSRNGNRSRIEMYPRTGRTHQLRVHAAHPLGLGAPIVGDRLYGHAGVRLMLHAESLGFVHPATGVAVTFQSPAPF